MKNLPCALAGAIISFAFLLSDQAFARANADDLLRPAAASKAAAEAVPALKNATRRRAVDINRDILRTTGSGLAAKRGQPSIQVKFFDDALINIEITGSERTQSGGLALMGRVAGDLSSSAVLVDNNGVMHIAVVAGGKRYSVQGTPSSGYTAAELGPELMLPGHGNAPDMSPVQKTYARLAQMKADVNTPKSGAVADDGSLIDVMVLYTPATRAAHGGVAQMEAAIDAQVAFTNLIYQNSGVVHRIRLVHKGEIPYTETASIYVDYGGLRADVNTAIAGRINILRDLYRADIVSIWGGWSGACGISTVITNEHPSFEAVALNLVTSPGCSGPGGVTFAHEIGHNMGLAHDYQSDPFSSTVTPEGSTTPTVINYAHGYSDITNRFRTIMSQSQYCVQQLGVDCKRIPYFSNPLLNYDNSGYYPMAVNAPMGDPEYGNETRALNDVRETVANFRVSLDGVSFKSLIFTENKIRVSEAVGNAVLTVKRAGSAAGAVSVNYATADASAVAGTAYAAVSGTLSWADGDISDRTITVPVMQDAVLQGSRSFNVLLSGATGGASAGNWSANTGANATVTITDDEPDNFPPNAIMPSGFSGNWVVSMIEGFQSPTSLSTPRTQYDNADLNVVGDFIAGTLTFRLKMNSISGVGPFKFLIDGVEVSSATYWPLYPPSEWQIISVDIPAGAHTLTWRASYNPFGMEHVWIDDVTFPVAGPPGAPTGLTAQSGNGQLTLAFTPGVVHGSFISSHTATCMPGNFSATAASSPIVVTGLTNGTAYTCTVKANSAQGPSLASAPVTATPVQGMQFTSPNTTTFRVLSGGSFSITSIGVASTFSVTGTLPAGVTLSSAGVLSGTPASGTAGSYPITITASPGGETQAFTLTVEKIPQVINFALPAQIQRGAQTPYTMTATGGASGNPVTFVVATTQSCSTSGTNGAVLESLTLGTCWVDASQAGNVDYSAAGPVRGSTYFIEYRPLQITYPATLQLNTTATLKSLPNQGQLGKLVTFTSLTPAVCTTGGSIADFAYGQFLSGHIVTPVATGLCRIHASVPATNLYLAAETDIEISVIKRQQAITLSQRNSIAVGESLVAVASAGPSGLPVVLSTSTPAFCSVNGQNVVGMNAGTCQITANQAGDATHDPAPMINKSITVFAAFTMSAPNHEIKLQDGRVMVFDGSQALIYNPASDQWTQAAPPIANHARGAAVLLADGRVLATGTENTAAASFYDPLTNVWSAAPPMSRTRLFHTLTRLPNGKILAAGGAQDAVMSGPTSTTEIFDPATNTWSAGPNMSLPRNNHTATLMGDGRVLMIGGQSAGNVVYDSTEWYDPTTNAWTGGHSMAFPRAMHATTLLPDGSVLVSGGIGCAENVRGVCTQVTRGAVRLDPSAGWRAESTVFKRIGHSVTALPDGTFLLAGGSTTYGLGSVLVNLTDIYLPATDSYSPGPNLAVARGGHRAIRLSDGGIMFFGGSTSAIEVMNAAMALLGTQMPTGIINEAYGPYSLVTRNAVAPVTFAITAGSLPPGLTFTTGGVVSGTPTQLGNFSITVSATDANSTSDSAAFTFSIEQRKPLVTVSVTGSNGSISPSQTQEVTYGGTLTYTLSPAEGYAGQVGGTCPGTLNGNIYTTGAITQDCSVIASFVQSAFPPSAPTITQVVPGAGSLTVQFTAGASNGSPITSFKATCTQALNSASSGNASGTSSPLVVSSLFTQVPYRCVVTATNAMGTSAPSAESDVVQTLALATTVTASRLGSGASGGRIVSTAAGIDCPGTCSGSVQRSISHTYTASVQPGTVFSGWTIGGLSCASGRNDLPQCDIAFYTPTGTVTAVFLTSSSTTVPAAPISVFGETVPGGIKVRFTANLTGSSPTTGFTATCTPTAGGTAVSATGTSTPVFVTGLVAGASYTCTVKATSALGTSSSSAASLAVQAGPSANLLSVNFAGSGRGLVTSTPTGISCSTNCSASFTPSTAIQLVAAPVPGSSFTGWSNGTGTATSCNGSMLACNLTLDADTSITANFEAVTSYVVTPSAGANGSITPSTPQSVGQGATTSFTVTPSQGYYATVGGTCGGTLTGSVYTTSPVVASCTVVASFVAVPISTLNIAKTGTGSGTISSTPAGIDCGADCSESIATGTAVTLTAAPASGSTFVSWSGVSCTGGNSTSTCSFTLNANTSVTASFNLTAGANIALHDLNDDGKSDVVWRNSSTGQNWYWALSGTTLTAQGAITTLAVDWQIQSTAVDFDGDGKSDILLRNMTTGQPWIWFMNGNTILSGGALPTLSDMNWTIAGTGDLNGDGKGDVIWRNTSTGQNWWWALNGTTIIAQGAITTIGTEWVIQSTLGDFNGDGKTDILWRNMTTGQPWVWMMNGNTIAANGPLPTLNDLNWTIAGTGDLNGDGKHDVVWRNTSTGQNWYWALNGTTLIAQGAINTLGVEWQFQSTSADFDGDGKTDILLRNMTTGQPWIWFMNGNTITSGGALPTLSDLNWQIRIRK